MQKHGPHSRINDLVLMEGSQGVFVAASCIDGSSPVLILQALDNSQEVTAIEPVDNPVAGEEGFKRIRNIEGSQVRADV